MTTTLIRPRVAQSSNPTSVAPRRLPDDVVTRPAGSGPDIVDVWGQDSFPASDPPANW